MDAALSTGLSAYQSATSQFAKAADKTVNGVRLSTIPSAPVNGANTPGAPAASPTAPIPGGGRALSSDSSFIEAQVDMIMAQNQAAAATSLIRAADDMIGQIVDIRG